MDNQDRNESTRDSEYGEIPDWMLRKWYDQILEAMVDLQENNDVRAYDRLQEVRDQLENKNRERGNYE